MHSFIKIRMKKNKATLIFCFLLCLNCFSQTNKIVIKYSIKDEKKLGYREKVVGNEKLEGYAPIDTIFFKNKLRQKIYFIDDKIYLKNKVIYCFKNVQYYEGLTFLSIQNKEYLYIYPHYYGRVGPYIWYGLGVLIEIKKAIVIKENFDYFEENELDQIQKFKKYKIRMLKNSTCADGSL